MMTNYYDGAINQLIADVLNQKIEGEAEPFLSGEESDEALAAFADGLPIWQIKEMMELMDLDRMKRCHNIMTADMKRKQGGMV